MENQTAANKDAIPAPVGHRVGAFVRAVGISRSGLYALPADQRPRSVAIGRRRIITEAPAAWLARVGKHAES